MLECQNLVKSFHGRVVLRSCSVTVRDGECVIVRGRSGGGKSTLLRCLAMLLRPDSGTVTHESTLYSFPGAFSNSRQRVPIYPFLTLVFQQIYLFPNLTIAENIALVVDGDKRRPLSNPAKMLLERMHVLECVQKHPAQCSLGQRQRVAVARAVLSPARFLLLDEPTSALDRRNRAELVSVLEEVKRAGRGLLVVSHDERDFETIADRTFELDGGVLTVL